ncbi:MAG: hypothetical protein FJ146_07560 [Deltaproteobacteria bacterium]|nr:hypothetical protein [Deltaproteobacteria bacterium]
MTLRCFILTLVCSSSLASAEPFASTCDGPHCKTLESIAIVANTAYSVGTDNNQIWTSYADGETLKEFSPQLIGPRPQTRLRELDTNNPFATEVKECLFPREGAYGEHLPTYSATLVRYPDRPSETIDLQKIGYQAFWRTLFQVEEQLEAASPGAVIEYSLINDIPEFSPIPAGDEAMAFNCAVLVRVTTKTAGQESKYLVLRPWMTD